MLRSRREVRVREGVEVGWKWMEKGREAVEGVMVAETLPELRVVLSSAAVVMKGHEGREGLPWGKREKCGPLFRAPCQCVVLREMMPSLTASMSWMSVSLCRSIRFWEAADRVTYNRQS